jgi:PPOX class probable F420-dependent enzyme
MLPESARRLIRSGALGHLATVGRDGAPQVTCVWVKVDGDDLLTAHLNSQQRKLKNVRRDPRVVFSFEGKEFHRMGMLEQLVVYGRAALEEGGAPELLHELAQTYVGPGTKFPPMDDPPPGVVMRTTVERVSGFGPWAE